MAGAQKAAEHHEVKARDPTGGADGEDAFEEGKHPRDQNGKFGSAAAHTEQAAYHHERADEHRSIGANFPLSRHQGAQTAHRTAAAMHNLAAKKLRRRAV